MSQPSQPTTPPPPMAYCGDGNLDPGEVCDGDCPSDCDDSDPCTTDTMTGQTNHCDVVCKHAAIIAVKSGDGCCTKGATSRSDTDCPEVCGNGLVEASEACDGNCPTVKDCDDQNPCTIDVVSGVNCDRKCTHEPYKENWGGNGTCVCDGRGACKSGGGTSPGPSGDANSAWYGLCRSDADCGGWRCVSSLCTADCSSDASCSASSAGAKATCLSGSQLCLLVCTNDNSCPAGQFCQDLGDVKVCNPRPCGHAGAPACPNGFSCQSSVCQPG